jgi:hypothetical protein
MKQRAVKTVVLAAVTFLCGCASTGQDREPVHLWPLFDRETSADRESVEVLWPLYTHEVKGDDYFLLRQVPLFTWERRGVHRELDVLWPLFNVHGGGDHSGARLVPLYFHRRSPTDESDVLFPVFWWRREKHFHLWPLYYWDENDGHGTLWPLVGFSSERTKVLPFYYSLSTEEESTWFVFPYGSRTIGDQRTHWVVPFYRSHHGPDRESLVVFPFWFHSSNTTADSRCRILFPFCWDFRRKDDFTTVVAPLYGRRHTAAGRDTYFIAPPLYIYDSQKATGRKTHHVLWPLLEYGSGPAYTQKRIFPLEYGWKEDTSDSDTHGVERTHRSHFRVYPLYYARNRVTESGETVRHHTLFPLWWYKDDAVKQRSHNVIFPLVWHYRSQEKATDVLFPLFWVEKDLSAEEDYYVFLWPLAWYSSSPQASDFRFLWKLMEVSHDAETERSRWALNPIVRVETIGQAEKRVDILGGLLGVHVGERGTTLRLFYFFDL